MADPRFCEPSDPRQTKEESEQAICGTYLEAGRETARAKRTAAGVSQLTSVLVTADDVEAHMLKCALKNPLVFMFLIWLRWTMCALMLWHSERKTTEAKHGDFAKFRAAHRLLRPLFAITNR
jgi:hypothetical protein